MDRECVRRPQPQASMCSLPGSSITAEHPNGEGGAMSLSSWTYRDAREGTSYEREEAFHRTCAPCRGMPCWDYRPYGTSPASFIKEYPTRLQFLSYGALWSLHLSQESELQHATCIPCRRVPCRDSSFCSMRSCKACTPLRECIA